MGRICFDLKNQQRKQQSHQNIRPSGYAPADFLAQSSRPELSRESAVILRAGTRDHLACSSASCAASAQAFGTRSDRAQRHAKTRPSPGAKLRGGHCAASGKDVALRISGTTAAKGKGDQLGFWPPQSGDL